MHDFSATKFSHQPGFQHAPLNFLFRSVSKCQNVKIFFVIVVVTVITYALYRLQTPVTVKIDADEHLLPKETWRTNFKNYLHFFQSSNLTWLKDGKCFKYNIWYSDVQNYSVIFDFQAAETQFHFEESVTYSTQGTYQFLNHLEQIVERWDGPISVAVYAPGDDVLETLRVVAKLRKCGNPAIKKLVSVHVFSETENVIDLKKLPCSVEDFQFDPVCGEEDRFDEYVSFKRRFNLTYPINVARNVARVTSKTRYNFPCDIELYPSPSLASRFMSMLNRLRTADLEEAFHVRKYFNFDFSKTVFVLPVFEIKAGDLRFPENKSSLIEYYRNEMVVPFHMFVCPYCHKIPREEDWLSHKTDNSEIEIFFTGKRHPPYENWEPFYIGTNREPPFNEIIDWEGMKDKMIQVFEMCLMDYSFSILDNAYLVHSPGIKVYSNSPWRNEYIRRNNDIVTYVEHNLRRSYPESINC